ALVRLTMGLRPKPRSWLLLAPALAACTSPGERPFSPTAPWTNGETSRYDVLGPAREVKGSASFPWAQSEGGWVESFAVDVKGKREHGTVTLDAALAPRASRIERGGTTSELTYAEAAIASRITAKDGAVTEKSLARPPDAVDNEASLQVQRG